MVNIVDVFANALIHKVLDAVIEMTTLTTFVSKRISTVNALLR